MHCGSLSRASWIALAKFAFVGAFLSNVLQPVHNTAAQNNEMEAVIRIFFMLHRNHAIIMAWRRSRELLELSIG